MTDRTSLPAVELAIRTDPGRDPDKQVNEDAALQVETALGLLCIVCDGMGGHAGGKEASELASTTISEIVQKAPAITSPRDALRVAIEEANRRVWSMPTSEGGYRPGSTVVAVLAHAAGADIAHVGDSRIYFVHAGAITQVTKDHSMVQEMVDRNLLRAEDAASHPDANKIMRAIGIAKEVDVDVRPDPIAFVAGDVFVLCSDGLSDLVSAAEILDVAGSAPPAQAAGQLVDLANARGGHDNITALVMRMKSSAIVTSAPTIVKTMQLTAHEPVQPTAPPDQGSGPRGTLLASPMGSEPAGGGSQGTIPLAPAGLGSQPNVAVGKGGTAASPPLGASPIPSAPRSSPAPERGSRASLVIGIVLAIAGLGLIGAVVWALNKPSHHAVPVIDDDKPREAGPLFPEEDAASTEITPAPPLTPPPHPSGHKSKWWLDPDAAAPNGEIRECAMARWGKAHGKPAADVAALEQRCRAQGGKVD
ncbi:MAG: protein phosphatase 2C domain-containing protein [Deltaproteobacteria bacterium]|nr:protein phosphatase 2C domain-containing protein [Deltaproteobacteria bacterium]